MATKLSQSSGDSVEHNLQMVTDLQAFTACATGRQPGKVTSEVSDQIRQDSPIDSPDFALIFASIDLCTERTFARLYEELGQIPIIGCSTYSQLINGEIRENAISVTLLKSSQIRFRAFSAYDLDTDPEGHAEDLIESIQDECTHPAAVLCFAPGFGTSSGLFIQRLAAGLPSSTRLSGALACGDPEVGRSFQVHGQRMMTRGCTLLVLDGDVQTATGFTHGMIGLGKPGIVTQAEGNTIYRIDDLPANSIYEKYLGERISDLETIGRTYPLGIGKPGAVRIRSIAGVDNTNGALLLSGPVEEHTEARVMLGQPGTFLRETRRLAEGMLNRFGNQPINLGFVFENTSRRSLMGKHAGQTMREVSNILSPKGSLVGFHSMGEIGKDGILGSSISVMAL